MSYHNPNPSAVDFGPRLTQEEHEQKVIALYSGAPPMPTAEQEAVRSRAELELLIDYHLGRDFPAERREALWDVKRSLDGRRLRMLVKAVLTSPLSPFDGLSKQLVRANAKVLNEAELRAFLDLSQEDYDRLAGRRLRAKTH